MNDSTSNSAGKSPLRKLGRGLGALLGAPVAVSVPDAKSLPEVEAKVTATRANQAQDRSALGSELSLGVPRGTLSPAASVEPKPSIQGRLPSTPESASERTSELQQLAISLIHPNTRQPRVDFDESSLKSLAESIRSAGLMQPIVVRPSSGGRYELVAGERRWRAAKLLGMTQIPALVRSISDQSAAELALIENVHREDLNAMERAFALRKLADDFSLTHAVMADRVGLDRASVTNLLRLTELDPGVATLVRTGALSQGHAKALLAITAVSERLSIAKDAVSFDWSVRELERRVKSRRSPRVEQAAGGASVTVAHVSDLERQISAQLGTKVRLQLGRKRGSGRLIVDFFTLDQFDGILARLGVAQLDS